MPAEAYGEFIKEAFIDPIRSVLIVDDKYPTIEQILNDQISRAPNRTYENPKSVLNVINGFRREQPALIVDVHDGELDVSEKLAKYLHQSDLLILDYELKDNGEKAVDIVKEVLANDHFNLIVVHTSSNPSSPFEKVLLSLIPACQRTESDIRLIQSGKEVVEDAEDRDPNILKKITDAVGFNQYIAFRHSSNSCTLKKVREGVAPFTEFDSLVKSNGWERRVPNEIFLWAISNFEDRNAALFGQVEGCNVNWANDFAGNPLWIRTDKGFITFVQKHDEINLLEELLKALKAWGPNPSRLLSAKLRAVLDSKGVIAEDRALNDRLVHAKFYQHLYADDEGAARRSKTDAQIVRKIEHLANAVQDEVTAFVEKVVDKDRNDELENSHYQEHYGVDLTNQKYKILSIKKFNAYVSCYPKVAGWHLAPGHILDIDGEKWVCLSPICDLVPSQKSHGIYGEIGDKKPFIAVRIFENNSLLTEEDINSNSIVFIPDPKDKDDIRQFKFIEKSNSAPHWSLFLADSKGKFNKNEVGISTLRVSKFGVQEGDDDSLIVKSWDCHIEAQLRYEYALNLMHKLGGEFTRIGLDYISS